MRFIPALPLHLSGYSDRRGIQLRLASPWMPFFVSEQATHMILSVEGGGVSLALSSRLGHDGLKWQRKVLLSWDDVTCRGSYRYRAEEHHPGESA